MAQAIKVSEDFYTIAKTCAKAEHRSIPAQIEYWAKIGRITHDNPDLPVSFIEGILISNAEYNPLGGHTISPWSNSTCSTF